MQSINLSNAQLSRAANRFHRWSGSSDYQLNAQFNGGPFFLRGIWRTNRHWILSNSLDADAKLFLSEMGSSRKSMNSTDSIENSTKDPINIQLVKIADLHYDDRIFQPMKTGDAIDLMFSSEGGIYPATNYMVIGDPGIGKSTQTLDILVKITKSDPTKKVLFISGEMNQIDMYGYVKRYPGFGQIPTLFLCDYLDDNPKEVIEKTLRQGWDLVLIDSFIEVQESVQAALGLSRTNAEKWMIDQMVHNNKGNNDENRFTSFLAIQQVTKGGNFVGSNKLKHNTTGMIELRFSSEFSGDRFAKVTKNRRGFRHEKIYFSLEKPEYVEYDTKRLERDEEIRKRLQREKEILLSEEEKFNEIFKINNNQSEGIPEFEEELD
jgi:predicted ATP-dependent serine protease